MPSPGLSTSILIAGTGIYSPSRVMTNDDLSAIVDTSDEWIVTRTGIRERRIAGPEESTSFMAVEAGRKAIADAGLTSADIDLVLVATMTPDMPFPATACLVQTKLGIPAVTCFDVGAACSGFLYAMDIATAMLRAGTHRHALVIGSEKISAIIDWTDRTTCVLFGDGAGAVVLSPREGFGDGILATRLVADGGSGEILNQPGGGALMPASEESVRNRNHFLKMKGKEVFKIAVRVFEQSALEILEQTGLTSDQIQLVIPHQANIRIIESLSLRLRLPMERFFINLDRYGNTSAASIPIALHEARVAGRIKPGDHVMLLAFGAGLTWASSVIRWA